jgi:flagellar motor protein MotB
VKLKNRFKTQSSPDEQGYLVSMSDLMSTLFFIVLLLLIFFVIVSLLSTMTKNDLKDKNNELENRVAALSASNKKLSANAEALTTILSAWNASLKWLMERNNQLDSQILSLTPFAEWSDARFIRETLLNEIKAELEAKGVTVTVDAEDGILRLPNDMLFSTGSADLSSTGNSSLMILAAILDRKLPCYSGTLNDSAPIDTVCEQFYPGKLDGVLIEGHTDKRPIVVNERAIFHDNLELSSARSHSAWSFLARNSRLLSSLRNAQGDALFGVSGYGEMRGLELRPNRENGADGENPYASMTETQINDLNRRIDIRFLLAAPPRPQAGTPDETRGGGAYPPGA